MMPLPVELLSGVLFSSFKTNPHAIVQPLKQQWRHYEICAFSFVYATHTFIKQLNYQKHIYFNVYRKLSDVIQEIRNYFILHVKLIKKSL